MTGVLEDLAAGAPAIVGRRLTCHELGSFDKYLKLIRKWQKAQRLVGSTDTAWIVEHLFLDSLLFLGLLPSGARTIADLGSGAGLPGVPLAIVSPALDITLIEARERRVSFLATVVRELGLANVRVVGGRAEDVAEVMSGRFDAVLIRCAGDPDEVLPVASRLAGPQGVVVLAGPPTRRPIRLGAWVEVPGVRPGATRRFLVLRK